MERVTRRRSRHCLTLIVLFDGGTWRNKGKHIGCSQYLKDHKTKKESLAPLYSRNWLKQHSQGDIGTHEKQTEHFSHKYMGSWGVEAIATGITEPYRHLQVRSSFLGPSFRFLKSVSLRHAVLKKLDVAKGLHNCLFANILKSPFNE